MSNIITNLCRPIALPPTQKCVLMALADRSDDAGFGWPSITYICVWTGYGRTAVIEALKRLEALELITVQKAGGRNNRCEISLMKVGAFPVHKAVMQQETSPGDGLVEGQDDVSDPSASRANQSASRTSPPAGPVRLPDYHPSASRTGTRPPAGLPRPPAGPNTSNTSIDTINPIKEANASSSPTLWATEPGGELSMSAAGASMADMAQAIPDCPMELLIDAYLTKLPMLPVVRKSLFKAGKGGAALRQRWKWVMTERHERGENQGQRMATTSGEGVEWFRKYFEYVAESSFLTGGTGRFNGCSLTWLVTAGNFEKVLSGNYENREVAHA